jgi:hypothetical protein
MVTGLPPALIAVTYLGTLRRDRKGSTSWSHASIRICLISSCGSIPLSLPVCGVSSKKSLAPSPLSTLPTNSKGSQRTASGNVGAARRSRCRPRAYLTLYVPSDGCVNHAELGASAVPLANDNSLNLRHYRQLGRRLWCKSAVCIGLMLKLPRNCLDQRRTWTHFDEVGSTSHGAGTQCFTLNAGPTSSQIPLTSRIQFVERRNCSL